MRTLQVKISPILDNLIMRLGKSALEDQESLSQGFKKSLGGEAWDFSGYREYIFSDDASLIDWKASVRLNKVLVREYTKPLSLEVLFLIDVSNSMLLGTEDNAKAIFAAEFTATLSYSIIKTNGKVGLMLFNEKVSAISHKNSGINQFYSIMSILTNNDLYGGGCSLGNAIKVAWPMLTKDTLIILVTDFLNLESKWESKLIPMSQKYSLLGVMIRSPLDRELPKGISKIFFQHPITGKKYLFHIKKHKEKYSEFTKKQEERIEKLLHSINADFLLLHTDKPMLDSLINFLIRREKRFQ